MRKVDLKGLDSDTSFKIKMEAYLYGDADTMLKIGKGDPEKLRIYMAKRIEVIENILKVKRPFRIVEGSKDILAVS